MLNILLISLVILLLIPVCVLFLQVSLAVFAQPRSHSKNSQSNHVKPTVAVIVPAHNESLGILKTLHSITPQLKTGDRLIVVADNCTDDTAQVVRDALADMSLTLDAFVEIMERFNDSQRGKGYALDCGVQQCRAAPPDVVIIIDADCVAGKGLIQSLAARCVDTQKPIQSRNLMRASKEASLKIKVAEFAMRVKNRLRPLGYQRIGMPCQLMGTGMALLWRDITNIQLASSHIVEDLKIGLELASKQQYPQFYDDYAVFSEFPLTNAGLSEQRARWEHGHMSVILLDTPKVLMQAILQRDIKLFALALDLVIPPLALLTMLNVTAMLLTLLVCFFTGWVVALFFALASLFLLASAILLAWWHAGRDLISLKQLIYLPLYLLLKIPLYIKFIFNRQVAWVRTRRDK